MVVHLLACLVILGEDQEEGLQEEGQGVVLMEVTYLALMEPHISPYLLEWSFHFLFLCWM